MDDWKGLSDRVACMLMHNVRTFKKNFFCFQCMKEIWSKMVKKKKKSITDTCFVMKRQKTYLAEYIYRVSFVLTWMWRFVIFAFPTQVWCATGAHTMTARVCERLMWCNSVCHLQKSACVVSIIPGKSKFIFNRHLLISFSRIRGKTSDSKRKKNHSKIFFIFFFGGVGRG